MRAILFGATGMVGQGVLRECVLDPRVDSILSIGRSGIGNRRPEMPENSHILFQNKFREIVHRDLWNYSAIESELSGFDACFFCLGISSAGLKPEEYERITYGITVAAGETLARLNSQMTFVFVSGAGTDSSEKGRVAWARVKGRAENALLRMPFKAAFLFRPGAIVPLHGIKSRTRAYRLAYTFGWPLVRLLRILFPNQVLTTEEIGRAMINVADRGFPKKILESADIRAAS